MQETTKGLLSPDLLSWGPCPHTKAFVREALLGQGVRLGCETFPSVHFQI